MTETLDARGLSCPQPMLLTRRALQKTGSCQVIVQVDTMTQVHNCSRAAEKLGWQASCEEKNNMYELTFAK
jgi:tRNA 2-thiouridine synthesizing protein A